MSTKARQIKVYKNGAWQDITKVYSSGWKNFRGVYANGVWYELYPYDEYTLNQGLYSNYDNDFVYKYGGINDTWSDIQGSQYGTGVGSSVHLDFEIRVADTDSTDGIYVWGISRSFMSFDLASIPSNAEVTNAYFDFGVTDENDSGIYHDFSICISDYGGTLGNYDYDSYDVLKKLADPGFINYTGEDPNGIRKEVSDYSILENHFGNILQVVLLHEADKSQTPPDNINDMFRLKRTGETLGEDQFPNLHIEYRVPI